MSNSVKENINRTITISITKEYKVICSITDSENNEEIIQLKPNQLEYNPCISFNNRTITICDETNEESIHFIEDMLTSPEEFTLYKITFDFPLPISYQ